MLLAGVSVSGAALLPLVGVHDTFAIEAERLWDFSK